MAKKILLVEDEKLFSNFMSELLEGYELQTAVDGIYGLKIGKIQKPDLLIIDLNLPRMNGEEMISKVKEDENLKNIPLVVISGTFARRYEGEVSTELNADAVFSKPFDLKKFKNRIVELIGNP